MYRNLEQILTYENENVIYGFCNDNKYVTEEDAKIIFKETLKWIWLIDKCEIDKQPIELNVFVIDEMWHTFILYTKDYNAFCNKYFNEYVHHTPLSIDKAEKLVFHYKNNNKKYNEYRKKIINDTLKYINTNLGRDTIYTWYFKFQDFKLGK